MTNIKTLNDTQLKDRFIFIKKMYQVAEKNNDLDINELKDRLFELYDEMVNRKIIK